MERTGCIYSILCKVNGKRYIGQTVTGIAERWRGHLQEAKQHSHRPLYRAINKYGAGMFVIREIESDVVESLLSEREQHWIEQFDTYNEGYNLTTGGEQNKNIHPDVRDKISQSMSGRVQSEQQIERMRSSLRKRTNPFKVQGDGKHSMRKVRATHKETGEIIEFNSITDAANKLNLKNGNICRCCKKGWSTGGYLWEYIDDKSIKHAIYGKRILDGKIVHQFNSIREAGRVLGTGGGAGVTKALKNPSRYSWKGCKWYYQTEEEFKRWSEWNASQL